LPGGGTVLDGSVLKAIVPACLTANSPPSRYFGRFKPVCLPPSGAPRLAGRMHGQEFIPYICIYMHKDY